MIDLFAIFSKGGLVLWCFQGAKDLLPENLLTPSVNALIREVFLQERGNTSIFRHNGATLKFKLDNEFELVFLAVYQSIVQLAYVDKLLTDVQLQFRDRYKNVLEDPQQLYPICGSSYFSEFDKCFKKLLRNAEETKAEQKGMRNWQESDKSQKTVASMIQKGPNVPEKKLDQRSQIPVKSNTKMTGITSPAGPQMTAIKSPKTESISLTNDVEKENSEPVIVPAETKDEMDEIEKNRKKFFNRMQTGAGAKQKTTKPKAQPVGGRNGKKMKEKRVWELGGTAADAALLDYSAKPAENTTNGPAQQQLSGLQSTDDAEDDEKITELRQYVGGMKGDLKGLDENMDYSEEEYESGSEEEEEKPDKTEEGKKGGFGLFSAFKSLVSNKKLSLEDIQPALEKMKDHLIAKNVAAEIAVKLCESVGSKLEGRVIGTFSGVTGTVKETLRESLVQLLSPKRRVDILRDVEDAKVHKRPYSVVFCGVNGVGKSTNLAKITFWLNDNGYRVLIAACDTFRAGAVEQLRTHARHLNALHPGHVDLYEQGYGKDAAAIAAQAITYATSNKVDVVLIDTAGRMQDNEPLMRALAKLIKVNSPDAVLFVGEALVGNEAVDQLVKFNQALADHATPGVNARLIDGIVLTKFDTIDDKVGAAISMTYITGQPIVFVGTGQTYTDLKNLNSSAIVHSLLK